MCFEVAKSYELQSPNAVDQKALQKMLSVTMPLF